MKTTKRIICLVIVATIVYSLCATAFAANACKFISGDITQTKSFIVTVGDNIFGNEKVVIKQSGGVAKYRNSYYGNTKRESTHGKFYITVVDRSTGKYVYKNKVWDDSQFTILSLLLKKNRSYKITIKGEPKDNVMNYSSFRWLFVSWDKYPTWKVTKTGNNIILCQ